MKQQYIETGTITGTHGVRGELRVQPWCDTPEDLTIHKRLYLDDLGEEVLAVTNARVHKQMVILKAKGIDTIEKAEALRGKVIYVNRKDLKLKEGQYLIADLIGCRVLDAADGKLLGEITQVSQTGANDVWHIQNGTAEYLIPAIPPVIESVNIDAGQVIITPLKGIFDHED